MEKEEIKLEELLKKVDTRYHLINLAGKRARTILMESKDGLRTSEAIDRSLGEIRNGKIKIRTDKKEGAGEDKKRKIKKAKEGVRKVPGRKKGK